LKIALSRDPDIEIVGTFQQGEELIGSVAEIEPDVALLDIELGGGMNGIEVAMRLREKLPRIGIVLLSNHRDPSFTLALRKGEFVGWAYLLKKSVSNLDRVRRAIAGVADGQIVLDEALLQDASPRAATQLANLTPRQREIVELIAQGYSNAGIASRLVVSIKTVENHINGLYNELNIARNGAYHPRVLAVLAYLEQSNLHQPMV